MASESHRSPARPDIEVLDALVSFPRALGIEPGQFQLLLKFGAEWTVPGHKIDKDAVVARMRAHSSSVVITRFKVQWPYSTLGNLAVVVERQSEGDLRVTRESPDNVPNEAVFDLAMRITEAFPAWRSQELAKKLLGTEMAEFYQRRDATLARLENLLDRSLESINRQREELARDSIAERREYKSTVDAETDKIRADLDARHRSLESALAQLEADRKALDDSSATHARREARKQISADVKAALTKFTVTEDTATKRRPIVWTFRGLMALTAISFLGSIAQAVAATAVGTPLGWFIVAKIPVSLIGFGLSASWYIRWENAWFQQHATEEFRLKRYDLDIHRATWLMELLFEWQEKKEHPIPPALVERLSHGMFDADKPSKKPDQEDDALASFLRHATNVRLPLPHGGELNITGSNFKKVEKETEAGR